MGFGKPFDWRRFSRHRFDDSAKILRPTLTGPFLDRLDIVAGGHWL
jgi:hypothetical protein